MQELEYRMFLIKAIKEAIDLIDVLYDSKDQYVNEIRILKEYIKECSEDLEYDMLSKINI